jgi:hypothetical protein
MRHTSVLVASSLLLGAMGACAASEDVAPLPNSDDAGGGTISDGAEDGGSDAGHNTLDASDAASSMCSPDGWCATPLPDSDLTFKDVWPLPGRAFAIVTSPTLGIGVLEWTDAAGRWTYIDDASQNESGLGKYAGRIWAPNDSEVYYGVSPGIIYHGTRPVPPQTEWTWTRSRLDDHGRIPGIANAGYISSYGVGFDDYALGVWGTGPDDVYAWYRNAIFHWKSEDGAPPSWVVEYAARDVPETNQDLYFLGAAGTNPDDVWFGGVRPGSYKSCAFVVNKVAGNYQRAADAVLSPSATTYSAVCVPPAGVQSVGGDNGWVGNIQSPGPGVAVMLNGRRQVARLKKVGDGYTADLSEIPTSVMVDGDRMLSLWAASEGEQWLSGKGMVVRAENAWDGGAYQISTLALRGAPIRSDLFRIRGTSNTNLWAIGAGYALHKTSP